VVVYNRKRKRRKGERERERDRQEALREFRCHERKRGADLEKKRLAGIEIEEQQRRSWASVRSLCDEGGRVIGAQGDTKQQVTHEEKQSSLAGREKGSGEVIATEEKQRRSHSQCTLAYYCFWVLVRSGEV